MCDETVARKHYSRIRYSSWGFNQCLLCDPVGGMGLLEKELRQRSKSKPRSETAEEGRNTPNGDATNHNMNKRRLKSMALGHLRGIVLFVLICFLATVSFLVNFIVIYRVIHQVWTWVGLTYVCGVPPAGGPLL